jgi:hypothetical protein
MSGYVKFENYNTSNGCRPFSVKGDSRVMNPMMLGMKSVDPYSIPNNGMRVLPPVKTSELNYDRLAYAYPQERIL